MLCKYFVHFHALSAYVCADFRVSGDIFSVHCVLKDAVTVKAITINSKWVQLN